MRQIDSVVDFCTYSVGQNLGQKVSVLNFLTYSVGQKSGQMSSVISVVNDIKVRHFLNFDLSSLVAMFSILFIIILLYKKVQLCQVFGIFYYFLDKSNVSDLATMIAFPTQ